jgi:hypothetical protein
MDMATQLPSLTEKQLSTMLGNAERLGLAGNKKQKGEAARLMPLIQAEIDDRKARAPVKVKAVRRPRKA